MLKDRDGKEFEVRREEFYDRETGELLCVHDTDMELILWGVLC